MVRMDNGRSISIFCRFQSCSYANDVATTHVVYSYYTVFVVVLWIVSVTTKTIKALTYTRYMYEPYAKNSKTVHDPSMSLEAAYLLLLIVLLLFRRKKKNF